MKGYAHGDFETRSTVDLRKTGSSVYADDETTDTWCFAWAIEDQPVQLWTPDTPGDIKELFDYLKHHTFIAHNATFELDIWNAVSTKRYGWPELDHRRVECTMAMSYALAMPGALDDAAKAFKLVNEKDKEGHSLMMRMARPRRVEEDGTIVWWDIEERKEKLYAYCVQDVEVERELHRKLIRLNPFELDLWRLDREVNQRGIPIDMSSVTALIEMESEARGELVKELRRITNNTVGSATQIEKMLGWLNQEIGRQIPSLDKAAVSDLLDEPGVSDKVRRVLEIRQQLGKASTRKMTAMRDRCNADARARGCHQYHGATTGRWAGRGIQTQNMPRPKVDQGTIDRVFEIVENTHRYDRIKMLDSLVGDPLMVMSDCLRGLITAPEGKTFLCSDFANIEGRVLAWLAGQEDKLESFRAFDRGDGPDAYIVAASKILGKKVSDVTKDERQSPGKVSELAFGYGGGLGAWRNFRPEGDTDEDIEAYRDGWRKSHSRIVDFWWALDKAAQAAVRKPGQMTEAGPIKYRVAGSFLFCQLPSKRTIVYPYPEIKQRSMPWVDDDGKPVFKPAVHFFGQSAYTRKWGTQHTYGGSLAENVTQAVARDVLAEAMIRLDKSGYPIVMHVHDEIVAEVDEGTPLEPFEKIMAEVPAWAEGLPIAVDGWTGRRYRK